MKKLLLAVAGAALALSIVPAHATPGNGCAAGGAANGSALTCTFTAGSASLRFAAATPNGWSITATHGSTTTTLRSSGSLKAPSQGTIAATPGDLITVTVGPDDASPAPVTGSIGIVAVADAS